MSVLWERGPSTAQEITKAIRRPSVARSSVMTLLGVLERKGFVAHTKEQRTFLFSALLEPDEARRTALRTVLSSFFGGSPQALVSSLVEDEAVSPSDIRLMRKSIDEAGARVIRQKRK